MEQKKVSEMSNSSSTDFLQSTARIPSPLKGTVASVPRREEIQMNPEKMANLKMLEESRQRKITTALEQERNFIDKSVMDSLRSAHESEKRVVEQEMRYYAAVEVDDYFSKPRYDTAVKIATANIRATGNLHAGASISAGSAKLAGVGDENKLMESKIGLTIGTGRLAKTNPSLIESLANTHLASDHTKEEAAPRKPFELRELSVYEQRMMDNALVEQRKSLFQPQVVMGHEYSNVGFLPSHSCIEFLDIQPGKTMIREITLTNSSMSLHSLRMKPLEPSIRTQFEIEFHPPGHIGVGVSVPLKVSFTPRSYMPIDTSVHFTTPTGTFSVPIIVRPPITDVSLKRSVVSFKSIVIHGSTESVIEIINSGARPAIIDIFHDPEGVSGQDSGRGVRIDESSLSHAKNTEKSVDFAEIYNASKLSRSEGHSHENTPPPILSVPFSPTAQIRLSLPSDTFSVRVGGYSSVKIPVTFVPHQAGHHLLPLRLKVSSEDLPYDMSELPVSPPTSLSLRIVGEALPLPLSAPSTLEMGTLLSNKPYAVDLKVQNSGKKGLRCRVEVPAPLRAFVSVTPTEAVVLSETVSGPKGAQDMSADLSGGSFVFHVSVSLPSTLLLSLPRNTDFAEFGEFRDLESFFKEANPQIFQHFLQSSKNDDVETVPRGLREFRLPLLLRCEQEKDLITVLQGNASLSSLEVQPSTIDFGNVCIGSLTFSRLTLYNPSLLPLRYCLEVPTSKREVDILARNRGQLSDDIHEESVIFPVKRTQSGGVGVLLPFERKEVSVPFRPASAGLASATIEVITDRNVSANVQLRGFGVKGTLALEPPRLVFSKTPAGERQFLRIQVCNRSARAQKFAFGSPQLSGVFGLLGQADAFSAATDGAAENAEGGGFRALKVSVGSFSDGLVEIRPARGTLAPGECQDVIVELCPTDSTISTLEELVQREIGARGDAFQILLPLASSPVHHSPLSLSPSRSRPLSSSRPVSPRSSSSESHTGSASSALVQEEAVLESVEPNPSGSYEYEVFEEEAPASTPEFIDFLTVTAVLAPRRLWLSPPEDAELTFRDTAAHGESVSSFRVTYKNPLGASFAPLLALLPLTEEEAPDCVLAQKNGPDELVLRRELFETFKLLDPCLNFSPSGPAVTSNEKSRELRAVFAPQRAREYETFLRLRVIEQRDYINDTFLVNHRNGLFSIEDNGGLPLSSTSHVGDSYYYSKDTYITVRMAGRGCEFTDGISLYPTLSELSSLQFYEKSTQVSFSDAAVPALNQLGALCSPPNLLDFGPVGALESAYRVQYLNNNSAFPVAFIFAFDPSNSYFNGSTAPGGRGQAKESSFPSFVASTSVLNEAYKYFACVPASGVIPPRSNVAIKYCVNCPSSLTERAPPSFLAASALLEMWPHSPLVTEPAGPVPQLIRDQLRLKLRLGLQATLLPNTRAFLLLPEHCRAAPALLDAIVPNISLPEATVPQENASSSTLTEDEEYVMEIGPTPVMAFFNFNSDVDPLKKLPLGGQPSSRPSSAAATTKNLKKTKSTVGISTPAPLSSPSLQNSLPNGGTHPMYPPAPVRIYNVPSGARNSLEDTFGSVQVAPDTVGTTDSSEKIELLYSVSIIGNDSSYFNAIAGPPSSRFFHIVGSPTGIIASGESAGLAFAFDPSVAKASSDSHNGATTWIEAFAVLVLTEKYSSSMSSSAETSEKSRIIRIKLRASYPPPS